MNGGLLDLPAPVLDLIDVGFAWLGLPALVRILIYAAASGWASMAVYRRCSKQAELAEVSTAAQRLRQELAGYDGPFDGLLSRVRQLLKLSLRHLGLSFTPALLAGLPLLLVLPWLSNNFSWRAPMAGTAVEVRPVALESDITAFSWTSQAARWDEQAQSWRVDWPAEESTVQLQADGSALLSVPLQRNVEVVHKRMPLFNLLIGNPAGYLPDDAPLDRIEIDFEPLQLHPFGPSWLREWLAVYLIAMFAVSLFLRWRWRLH